MMQNSITLALFGALSIYPVVIYFFEDHLSPSQLLSGLLLLVCARLLVLTWRKPKYRARYAILACAIFFAAIFIPSYMPHLQLLYLRFYPALFSLVAFSVFFISLFTKMPLVERLARIQYPNLSQHAVLYTYRVTLIWCCVLFLNVAVSMYTAVATSLAAWSFYNGLLIYFILGGVYTCEYLIRLYLFRKWAVA
ncbi:MAG: hypothetical protein KGL13_00360 [Gammaproteobacteria bacterium]|nr:hypothetical protein [Gammaproteobacteria bacterium]